MNVTRPKTKTTTVCSRTTRRSADPRHCLLSTAMAALTLAACMPIAANAADFRTRQSGYWHYANTWEEKVSSDPEVWKNTDNYPGADDYAHVRHGVSVTRNVEAADHITVNAFVDLVIHGGGRLTLDGDDVTTHSINGTIDLIGAGSKLRFITNSQTLSGSGLIKGQDHGAHISLSNSVTLTSGITIEGALQIRACCGTFINGATGLVHANRSSGDKVLMLYDGTFDDADGAEWKVSNHADAILRFSVAATGLEGDFTVHDGTLDIDASVCTTGDLSFTGGKIDVASACSAKFSQSSCPQHRHLLRRVDDPS